MKKKLAFLLSGMLAASCMPLNLVTNASSYTATAYTLETETFKYTHNDGWGISFECTPEIPDIQKYWMITGSYSGKNGHFCTVVEFIHGMTGNLRLSIKESEITGFTGEKLVPGDIISVDLMTELSDNPAIYFPASDSDPAIADFGLTHNEVKYVGYGTDVFGEEFIKVIRHELVTTGRDNYNTFAEMENIGIENLIVTGDTNEDEKVSIMDVVLLNKAIYGKAKLCDYAVLATDFNQNGVPDASDSLDVMKKVIGLT